MKRIKHTPIRRKRRVEKIELKKEAEKVLAEDIGYEKEFVDSSIYKSEQEKI